MADNIRDAYNVNLADGVVPNVAKRNRMYQGMLLYFIVCGMLLIEGGWRMANGYLDVKEANLQTERIKREFDDIHPGVSLESYANVLKGRLEAQKGTFAALDKNLPSVVPAMEFMYELYQAAPSNSTLMQYNVSAGDEGVTWQCRVVQSGNERIDSNELVKKWRMNEKLQKYVSNIMMMNLQDNIFVNGVPAEIITCRAKLNKGDK